MTSSITPTSATPTRPAPKAFLSYSHSSPDYGERVAALADRLARDGVEVVFDQWDLDVGHDLHAFMERAVNDASVTHVVILCDPVYAEKADRRTGGVGTETLILSPGVYRDVRQERVVPVIFARDPADQVHVPTYLDGRRYLDLSTEERAVEGYEQLLRTLHNKPARTRPPLGRPPAFLDETHTPLATAGAAQIARAAIAGHRPDTAGRIADYLDRLGDVIAGEEISGPVASPEDLVDRVRESIGRFTPYRDEFVDLWRAAARYAGDRPELYDRLHAFFERVASLRLSHTSHAFREAMETENLAFIGWELMLAATAVLLQEGQVSGLARLLRPLYVRSRRDGDGALRGIDVLEPGFPLFEYEKERSQGRGPRWLEPAAQLLRERHDGGGLPFEAIMEADVLLWYRTVTDPEAEWHWVPRTMVYGTDLRALPLFARAQSPTEFARLAPALGAADRAEFVRQFRAIPKDQMFRFTRYGEMGSAPLFGIRPDE